MIGMVILGSTLRSKVKKLKPLYSQMIIKKILSNFNNFFSKTEYKLQLVQFPCNAAPRYAKRKEDYKLYICGGVIYLSYFDNIILSIGES